VSLGDVVNTFLEHVQAETLHLRHYEAIFLKGSMPTVLSRPAARAAASNGGLTRRPGASSPETTAG